MDISTGSGTCFKGRGIGIGNRGLHSYHVVPYGLASLFLFRFLGENAGMELEEVHPLVPVFCWFLLKSRVWRTGIILRP